jgi:hypothetical protein
MTYNENQSVFVISSVYFLVLLRFAYLFLSLLLCLGTQANFHSHFSLVPEKQSFSTKHTKVNTPKQEGLLFGWQEQRLHEIISNIRTKYAVGWAHFHEL